ncbi:hypothetical protein ACRALDRAFT_1066007 [Sodiomyces alcalophilus JCM 7366]|uniref:uncharacterized protein n=1 Tax=Sodiomyces alcalophilus JCM 7366 TaxID=591952 RepID=UPI0039B48C45
MERRMDGDTRGRAKLYKDWISHLCGPLACVAFLLVFFFGYSQPILDTPCRYR